MDYKNIVEDSEADEEEKMKNELSGMQLYEDGMSVEEMKHMIVAAKESKEMAESSSDKNNSILINRSPITTSCLDSSYTSTPKNDCDFSQSYKGSIFEKVLDDSSSSNEVSDTSAVKTERKHEEMEDPTKINLLACSTYRPDENIEDMFKRLRTMKSKELTTVEKDNEVSKSVEDYDWLVKQESQRLEETSFRQKYADKLSMGYDFTEIKWGSPIKVSENEMNDEQPSCSFPTLEESLRGGGAKEAAEVSLHDRATKRKACYNIRKCIVSENTTTLLVKEEEFSPTHNIEDVKSDESSEDFLIYTTSKKRKRTKKNNSKGNKKSSDTFINAHVKDVCNSGKRKLYSKKQNDNEDIRFSMDIDEEVNDELKVEKANKDRKEVIVTDNIMEPEDVRKTCFLTRLERQKSVLLQRKAEEEKQEKAKKIAEMEKETVEKMKIAERVKQRQKEEHEKKQKEKEIHRKEDASMEYWRRHIDKAKKPENNREKTYESRSTRIIEIYDSSCMGNLHEEPAISCPICDRNFPRSQIQNHASECQVNDNLVTVE